MANLSSLLPGEPAHPATPNSAVPTNPAPLSFRKSRRLILWLPRISPPSVVVPAIIVSSPGLPAPGEPDDHEDITLVNLEARVKDPDDRPASFSTPALLRPERRIPSAVCAPRPKTFERLSAPMIGLSASFVVLPLFTRTPRRRSFLCYMVR